MLGNICCSIACSLNGCHYENMPAKPTSTVTVSANGLLTLLSTFGIKISGSTGDFIYKLMSESDVIRFIKWYADKRKYTDDDYDCDKFAWVMRAEALKWTGGEYAWGYIEAEGIDPEFPNHGFCFIPTSNLKVYFTDELWIAAPKDDIIEAYPIKCNMAKI